MALGILNWMNAMRHNNFSLIGQKGITLLEVLISLGIFFIGLLSLLHYSASSVKQLSENNPRSMALDAAADSMVQIYIAANNNELDVVKTKIQELGTIQKGTYTFTLTPGSLKNGDGSELLQNSDGNISVSSTDTWVSPLSLGLRVQFLDHTNSQQNVTINVPFTIVFQSGA